MQQCCLERLNLGLSLFPAAPVVYWGENTSSSSISPPYYRKYSLAHVREYAAIVHQSGKRLIVHMCGLLKDLLDCFLLTGGDGIHSVTPSPIGDTPYRLVRGTSVAIGASPGPRLRYREKWQFRDFGTGREWR